MIHKMRLVNFAFEAIEKGDKTVEVRLNDEKRQLIKIGDIIEFQNIDTGNIIKTKVKNLYHFKTFNELFNSFDNKTLGLEETDDSSIMDNFYTKEEQEKYGALGIEIEKI